MLLVSVLLRLTTTADRKPIAAFEEPEEALEPLRQTQVAQMLVHLADEGSQVFVVTHSPEIARAFAIEDFVLMSVPARHGRMFALRERLSSSTRQAYERWLDGGVVRGLFANVTVLVEGPGDRAVLHVFINTMARAGLIPSPAELGLEIINTEGAPNGPMLATALDEAGKTVVAWVETDTESVRATTQRMREEGHCSAFIAYPDEAPALEAALAVSCSLESLAAALTAVAVDRGYDWDQQRHDLAGRISDDDLRPLVESAGSVTEVLGALPSVVARDLVRRSLASKSVTPFEMKGGRQARLIAETIADTQGVPTCFSVAIKQLIAWAKQEPGELAELVMPLG
jgi:hypothetical protein